jgi:hypothetical protein
VAVPEKSYCPKEQSYPETPVKALEEEGEEE